VCPSAAIVAAFSCPSCLIQARSCTFLSLLTVVRYAAIGDDVLRCWRSPVIPIAKMKLKS
jgi:hypothetical protein